MIRRVARAAKEATRVERDSMGEMPVPADVYYGAQTARAALNFPISGLRFPRRFIRALALVKRAAAVANADLGLLDRRIADAVVRAADEVAAGKLDDQFVVDVFQTGSGTSTNMNANEVIANRAAEILGGRRGDKSLVHPNDHVNMGQSTNDTFPTAIHVAALEGVESALAPALESLAEAFERKAAELATAVKAARTHLQDAVPITLGQELSGYAAVARLGVRRLEACKPRLAELALGGTAAGTGLNAHPRYAELAIAELARLTAIELKRADNPFEAMQNRDACVETSAALKTIAVGLLKITNDLRLLASGPRTGLAEIELPAIQPGSSIMPGKVNPVIPEALNMVAAKVIGNDATITVAGLNGSLDLNVMMPVIAYALIESIEILASGCRVLAECVAGIEADRERCRAYGESSLALVTVLAPTIGYDAAAAVAKRVLAEGKSVREVLLEEKLVELAKLDEMLDLLELAYPHGGAPRTTRR
jgi:fumarate hydratase class II